VNNTFVFVADYIITVDQQRRIIKDGAVAVKDGLIRAVGKKEEVLSHFPGAQVLGGSNRIIIPGLINSHFHLPQMLMRGVSDNVDAITKLREFIWPIQGNYDNEDALISSRLAFLEMIKAGTTCFLGTGLHPRYGIDAICQELLNSGLRGVISKYVMDSSRYSDDKEAIHPGLWEDGATSLRQAEELIERWNGKGNGRINIWLSPRSVGGCSPDLLRKVSAIAARYGVGITAHWLELPENVSYIKSTYGMTPCEFAQDTGLLGPKTVFAHGIYLNESELSLLSESGTSICHCPVCNAKLAMGTAKVKELLREGVNVCLGTDGVPVNNTADMFREMRAFCILQRGRYNDPTFPTAETAIELATINGAKALGLEKEIGSIEVGKKADLAILNINKPHLVPLLDPVSAVVWSATGADVETTVVDGKIIMLERKVLTLAEEEILERAQTQSLVALKKANIRRPEIWTVF